MAGGMRISAAMATGAAAIAWVIVAASPTPGADGAAKGKNPDESAAVAQARERAKLLHEVYSATLDAMHHHYFRPNHPVLPARAMEEVFADVARRSQVKARWLAVNSKAMSIDHEPKGEFDRKAVAALSNGDASYEQIENGELVRVSAIPLTGGCISCHVGLFPRPTKAPRVAGLVVSVPLPK